MRREFLDNCKISDENSIYKLIFTNVEELLLKIEPWSLTRISTIFFSFPVRGSSRVPHPLTYGFKGCFITSNLSSYPPPQESAKRIISSAGFAHLISKTIRTLFRIIVSWPWYYLANLISIHFLIFFSFLYKINQVWP